MRQVNTYVAIALGISVLTILGPNDWMAWFWRLWFFVAGILSGSDLWEWAKKGAR